MTKKSTTTRPQVWEAKWAFVPTMNQHADMRKHLCVAVRIEGETVTLLPTSTKPVQGRSGQRSILWGGAEVFAATNRVFTMNLAEWIGTARSDAKHQPDKEVRTYLKQEMHRA